nr:uncharacterized protein LOC112026812 [Quercus suber]
MRLLSWNCQGLGNPWIVRSLHDIVRDQAPTVCFLMETRLDRDGFMHHCRDLAFPNKLIVKKPESGGEKLSIHPPSVKQMEDFGAALEECHLIDLGFRGYKFTWNNKRPSTANTRERLDRAVVNKDWIDMFPASMVSHIFSHASDHMPLLLQTRRDNRFQDRMSWGFKFEERWLLEEECGNVVEEAWRRMGGDVLPMVNVSTKINQCGAALSTWGSTRTKPEVAEIKRCDRVEECLNAVNPRISADMLSILSDEFCAEEVKTALFQMGPTKAPGPDGNDVTNAVLDFLNTGLMLPELNYTHIVLIPKSAFVHGRLITDNVIVAYETLHAMHGWKKGKKGALALKLDISKAYDRVEWAFLKGMLIKLGFPQGWINRIMGCVTSSSFSVWINGKAYGNFRPTRGLRQGDPLSPYLFLICAEAFSSLLTRVEGLGRIHGVSICRYAPSISHLLFADDSLVFCQANQEEVQVISDVLELYAVTSGQCINFEKSSVYFSSNTSRGQRDWIKNSLGVVEVDKFESYLGLPTLIGRSKYQAFSFLKERVWKKIQGWKGKLLSKAGKEVLVGSKWGCKEDTLEELGVPYSAKEGGWYGIPRHPKFQLSYAGETGVENKSLLAAQPILRRGCCWRVGSGSSIRVLSDKWLPGHPTNKILIPPNVAVDDWVVSELIDWNTFQWDRTVIDVVFSRLDVEAIYRIPLCRRYVPDVMVWLHNKDGRYSVRSGYHTTRTLVRESSLEGASSNLRSSSVVWTSIWKLRIPNKIKVFMWQACHNILPTLEKLRQRRIVENELCPICKLVPKTILHALWECKAAQDVWAGCSQRVLQKGLTVQSSMLQLTEDMWHKMPLDVFEFFLVLCWLLWHRRNRVVFGGLLQEPGALIGRARCLLAEFVEARTHLAIPESLAHSQRWQPPVGSRYKLNFDVAVFSDISASGVGVIIRNGDGQVMAALSARGPAVTDGDEAEVLACRRGLEFAMEAGFGDLIVEGDNLNVMQAVASNRSDWSRLGNLVDDVRHLAGRLRLVDFQCIRRSANGVAHSLARFARNISEDCVWLEDTPPPAAEALFVDSLSLSN